MSQEGEFSSEIELIIETSINRELERIKNELTVNSVNLL